MKALKKLLVLIATAATITACDSDGGGLAAVQPATGGGCSLTVQKQFVLDNMLFWYLWNDQLPTSVNINDYEGPDELLGFLTSFSPDDGSGQPVDKFSFLTSATSDAQFFGEGRYEGFGYSSRTVAAGDLRLSRVFVDSPAWPAGLRRGQRIVALDGQTIAELEASGGVGSVLANDTVEFTMRPVGGADDGSEDFVRTISKAIVTIDPLPQYRLIDASGGRKVAYIEFSSFISTAESGFATIFSEINAENVTEVIIDMRYNGGGLVRTAELLGDYLGGQVANGLVFSTTEFNADRAPANNSSEFFQLLGDSMNLTQFVVIASRSTASASELVINGLRPHAPVTIVGDNTFGKPVGQVGLELTGCDVLLRPTAFQTVNALGDGDFFGGLPVTPGCEAADDLDVGVGTEEDPNLQTALYYLENNACPPAAAAPTGVSGKTTAVFERLPDLKGPPHREFADAW